MLGKLFGLMIGGAVGMLLLWSPPFAGVLAVAGALLGHFLFDRESASPKVFSPPTTEELLSRPRPVSRPAPKKQIPQEDLTFIQALCPLFIEVARADAPVAQLEVRIVREFFQHRLQFGPAAMDEVRDALKAAVAAPPGDIEALTVRARGVVKPSMRIEIVRSLYDLGMADGDLQRSEQDVLKRIVSAFNLSDEALQEITSEYFGKGDSYYKVLNVTSDSTDDEVKSAYRKLAAEHHPDRANDGGEKFRQIKDAYEALKKLRGF